MRIDYVGYLYMSLMGIMAGMLTFFPGKTWKQRVIGYRYHQWVAIVTVAFVSAFAFGGWFQAAITKPAPTTPPAATQPTATQTATGQPTTAPPATTPQSTANQNTAARAPDPKTEAKKGTWLHTSFVIFFLGIVRTIMETAVPERRNRSRTIFDVFLLALIASLLLDLAEDQMDLSGKWPSLAQDTWGTTTGLIATLCFGIVYLGWTYSLLNRQLTQVDEFPAHLVNTFLLRSLAREVPLQVVLIGPKKAGKSSIFKSIINRIESPPTPAGQSPETASSESASQSVFVSKPKQRVVLSLIDTPGEMLGQHLAAAINHRSDALAFVINARTINWAAFAEKNISAKNVSFETFLSDTIVPGGDTAVYLRALQFATHNKSRGTNIHIDSLAAIYKVQSFCLIIYGGEGTLQGHDKAQSRDETLQAVAEILGGFFGVRREACSTGVLHPAGDGSINSQRFIDLVCPIPLKLSSKPPEKRSSVATGLDAALP